MATRLDAYTRLRLWPRHLAGDERVAAQECAEFCRELFRAGCVLLALEQGDEPWLTIAVADDSGFSWNEEQEGDFWPIVATELEDATFYLHPDSDRVTIAGSDAAATVPDAIAADLRKQLGTDGILSAAINTENVRARLFACAPEAGEEMLLLAEVAALLTGSRLEAAVRSAALVSEAVVEERRGVARDLHDGLLQSFTGVVLQLETIHSILAETPDEARRLITETQATMMADQRELRRFVEQLRPNVTRREATFDFMARLADLRTRFASQWGVHLTVDVDRVDPAVSPFIGHETFRLIHEAVTNSAKHGRASEVRVGVRTTNNEMHIEVADNGGGFPFQGTLTLDELKKSGQGPLMLADRLQSLNGNLAVESNESGATVRMSVPLGWGAS
jgi:signal transduction histidine kinase